MTADNYVKIMVLLRDAGAVQ